MPDERPLWVGQPDPSKHFSSADRFLVPFSLLWASFAVFWEVSAIFVQPSGESTRLFFPLFGLFFVVMGLYFVFGRFITRPEEAEDDLRSDKPPRSGSCRAAER